MMITKLSKLILCGALLGAVAVVPACKKDLASGGGELTPPEAPEYANAFEELQDKPNQIDAQIKWITQPIDDAHALGAEFNALKDELGISAEDLGAMASVTFKDGTITVSAELNIAEEQRAAVEAFLGKVKQAGLDVQTIPARAKKVSGNLTKTVMSAPSLAAKATKDLKAELTAAVDDAKAEIQAKIESIPNIQSELVAKGKASIEDVKNIPTDSKAKIEELVLAFAGKGEFKASVSGGSGEEPASDPFAEEGDLEAEAADAEADDEV